MDTEIELINDGDGIALVGDAAVVDRFLHAQGLPSRELNLTRLNSAFSAGALVAEAASKASAESGRWVKLSKKSAEALKTNTLMKGSSPLYSRAVLTKDGKISGLLEFVKPDRLLSAPGALLTSPAALSGAAGLMAQIALEQAMDEIVAYLENIDEKLDDILRGQKDAVLADMVGVGFIIEDALTIRKQVGKVSEVTWSKVQSTILTIARTQAYALRAIDALAEKAEKKSKLGELSRQLASIDSKVVEWFAVLARCFQLQDAISVLELDRVLETSPEELDEHRSALQAARENRIEHISRNASRLMSRMIELTEFANSKVLLHPNSAKSIVTTGNSVTAAINDFLNRAGLVNDHTSLEVKPWSKAVAEVRDDLIGTATEGVNVAKRLGGETAGLAISTKAKALETGSEGMAAAKSLGAQGVDKVLARTERLSRGIADRLSRLNDRPKTLERSNAKDEPETRNS